MILGIDEVGRGPWAGPLVVGAVVLGNIPIEGLTDSKKLSAKKREILADMIMTEATAVSLGWVSARELDAIGMSAALRLATRRAVEQISVPYHEIIIDGTINFLAETSKGSYVTTMAKADGLIASVSAASIVAKVARDRYMAELPNKYAVYGFERHAGYGTAFHRTMIAEHGVSDEHRLSFAPLKQYQPNISENALVEKPIASGPLAESAVAAWYESDGWQVLARNWRTRWCEIDLVVKRDKTIRCVEVKYRKNSSGGGPLAMMSPVAQRKRLQAAAQFAAYHQLDCVESYVVPVRGDPMEIGEPILIGQSPFN
jgi:ribonuclease HII